MKRLLVAWLLFFPATLHAEVVTYEFAGIFDDLLNGPWFAAPGDTFTGTMSYETLPNDPNFRPGQFFYQVIVPTLDIEATINTAALPFPIELSAISAAPYEAVSVSSLGGRSTAITDSSLDTDPIIQRLGVLLGSFNPFPLNTPTTNPTGVVFKVIGDGPTLSGPVTHFAPIPEPATVVLAVIGIFLWLLARRRILLELADGYQQK